MTNICDPVDGITQVHHWVTKECDQLDLDAHLRPQAMANAAVADIESYMKQLETAKCTLEAW